MVLQLKRSRENSVIWTLLFIAFFCHGILYFFSNVNAYYSYESPIKLIKYVLFLLMLCLMLLYRFDRIFDRDFIAVGIAGLMAAGAFAAHSYFRDYIILANYCVPVFTLMLYPVLSRRVDVKGAVLFSYVFASAVGYVEFLFLKGRFAIFADSGYRACSVFVNPNNFAAFLFLSASALLMEEKSFVKKLALLGNTFILLVMTGSRSGLLLMAASVLLIYGYRVLKHVLSGKDITLVNLETFFVLAGMAAALALLVLFSDSILYRFGHLFAGGRKLGQISLRVGRFYQYTQFFERGQFNLLFPNYSSEIYTDNLFLHLWGFFGLPAMVLYILGTGYLGLRLWRINRKRCLLLVLLFMFGMFENFLYFWPIAYVYWYLAGTVIYGNDTGAGRNALTLYYD